MSKQTIHPDAQRQCGGWFDLGPYCSENPAYGGLVCERCQRERLKGEAPSPSGKASGPSREGES